MTSDVFLPAQEHRPLFTGPVRSLSVAIQENLFRLRGHELSFPAFRRFAVRPCPAAFGNARDPRGEDGPDCRVPAPGFPPGAGPAMALSDKRCPDPPRLDLPRAVSW